MSRAKRAGAVVIERLAQIGQADEARNWRKRGVPKAIATLLTCAEKAGVSVDWLLGRPGAQRTYSSVIAPDTLGESLRVFVAERLVAQEREARHVRDFLPSGDELLGDLTSRMIPHVDALTAQSRAKTGKELSELADRLAERQTISDDNWRRLLDRIAELDAMPDARMSTVTRDGFLFSLPWGPQFDSLIREQHARESSPGERERLATNADAMRRRQERSQRRADQRRAARARKGKEAKRVRH